MYSKQHCWYWKCHSEPVCEWSAIEPAGNMTKAMTGLVLISTVPPTMPLNLRVMDLMPFSASLQWNPPSDNGGSSLPLTYTVTLINTSTFLPFSDITATSLPLPNLQHSTQYSWSVQAINEYGSSPPAEGTFTTNDTGKHDQVSPYYVIVHVSILCQSSRMCGSCVRSSLWSFSLHTLQ